MGHACEQHQSESFWHRTLHILYASNFDDLLSRLTNELHCWENPSKHGLWTDGWNCGSTGTQAIGNDEQQTVEEKFERVNGRECKKFELSRPIKTSRLMNTTQKMFTKVSDHEGMFTRMALTFCP